MTQNFCCKIALAAISLALFSSCAINQSSMSDGYSFIYSAKEGDNRSVYLSDQYGRDRLKVIDLTNNDGYPSISPHGKTIAFYGKYDNNRTWSIHKVDLDGSNVIRLTNKRFVWDSAPSWSPDGSSIIFSREYKGASNQWQEEVWLMDENGNNQRQIHALKGRAASFLPDGKIIFQSNSKHSQLFIADIHGNNQVQLTDTNSSNRSPAVSPNGKYIAFLANRDGNQEVYVMNIDGSDQRRLTFNNIEDWDPAWSADSNYIYFISQNESDFYDVFSIHRDGSSLIKILNSGSQVNSVINLDTTQLSKLKEKQ
ncbi:TolB family protein [Pseudoalteromonas obscura]|uniref:DUF5050 domain-containing protein n=1 Tax=Pseudoalteromonas obscura TaxID=3048491 RepID=A0ABT7ENM3_9GAMM|nr:DUF5050 domain-containing protein [Pseudoalteromonas sp. P94(2023)]MDK2596649.1 DUF5050 domain-containing protein [Pseudoalteromonas sp. P94(2023)]